MRKTIFFFLFLTGALIALSSETYASREYEQELWHQYTISRKNVVFIKVKLISEKNSESKLILRGSGVLIKKTGEIATNAHLFYFPEHVFMNVAIETWDGKKFPAKLAWMSDKETDLAKITVDHTFDHYAEIKIIDFDSMTVDDLEKLSEQIGPILIMIGHPFGELLWHPKYARITHPSRKIEEFNLPLIELDAFVNPGNSGGGLFTEKGYLIGIPNITIPGSGIGFAIPVKRFCDIDPEACLLPTQETSPNQIPFPPSQ